MIDASTGTLKHVVFEASSVIDIDFTAAQALRGVIEHCRNAGISFRIARLETVRAQKALERFGIVEMLGPNAIFRSVDNAITAIATSETTRRDPMPPASTSKG